MSISPDRKLIYCNGIGCQETASIPIALRTELSRSLRSGESARSGIEGWLFVRRGELTQHFCPACNKVRLATLTQEISH